MSKKIVLVVLVLLGFMFSQTAEKCFADSTSILEQANSFEASHDYLLAEELYESILSTESGTANALKAQRGLAVVFIQTKMPWLAEQAIEKIVADYDPNMVAGQLFGIARQYEWSAEYEKASALFQRILDDYPGSWYVNRADLGVVRNNIMALIAAGGDTEEAINGLNGFANHMDMAQTIESIAKRYNWSHNYSKAETVLLQLLQQFPNSPYAAKVGVKLPTQNVLSLIEAGEDAQSEINKLVADFSNDSGLPAALYAIANKYEWTAKFVKAKGLYQQIAQQYSESSQADNAQLAAAKVDILMLVDSGEDEAVESALDKLVADFNDHPGLATAVSRAGEQYQIKANGLEGEAAEGELKKAVAIWEGLIDELNDIVIVPQACCYAGDCYRRLGEYEKSAVCYEKVADDYPCNSLAWHALFMVGRNYEALKKAGTVSESIADAKIKAAYEQVVEDYPDCKAARAAQRWLDHNDSN